MMSEKKIVIYHTSDIHNRGGFGARLAALVEPDAVLVDCGDSLRGSSTVFHRHERVMKEFATARYAAQAVGNREFHYMYACFLGRARAMPMPMICSNLIDMRGRVPAPYQRELRLNSGGLDVRLLSVLAPQYRTGSLWERVLHWRFLAPEAALEEMLRPERPADVTLLLSHLGLQADRALAARFPSLSAIVGGHSHERLAHPEVVCGTPIAHAGPFADYVGRLELAVGGSKPVLSAYRLVPLLARPAG